jgi:Concanavalin A-like lectin/glucanases superfamily
MNAERLNYGPGSDFTSGSIRSFIFGPSLISQLVLVVVAVLVLQIVMVAVESVWNTFKSMDQKSVTLFNSTTASEVDIPQGLNTGFPILYNSRDEQQGSAFSYSAYIFINPDTFERHGAVTDSQANVADSKDQRVVKLKHIFHKGSTSGFPNLGPAVFVESNTNTLRVYMNTVNAWNNYVTIPNIPVGKWFHLAVILKGKNLDVYVNGNVSVRMKMATAPKLNNGSVYVMKNLNFPDRAGYDPGLFADYTIDGAMKGMVSRLKYFAYALNYSQIDAYYREGPNTGQVLQPASNRADANAQVPPYFFDSWWVQRW